MVRVKHQQANSYTTLGPPMGFLAYIGEGAVIWYGLGAGGALPLREEEE